MMRIAIRGIVLCTLAGFGCGPSSGGGDDEALATLTIDPPTAEVLILNGVAATQAYTATLTFPDGHTTDVTADTVFQIDTAYGTFNANTASIGTAGKTQVYGQHLDKIGTAELIARLKLVRVDPTLDPNTPQLFTGPEDPARAPTVVYPAANVIVPRNLG